MTLQGLLARLRLLVGRRAALGASAGRILTGVLSRAAAQLGLGIVVGLVLSLALDRLAEGELLWGTRS